MKVFCVTESHLLSSMPSSFVSLPSFSVVRNDVSGNVEKHGVCMYIHNSLKYVTHQSNIKNCVAIELVDLKMLILAVYRPPSYSDAENSMLIDYLLTVCSDYEVLVLGDFNLPSLQWEKSDWMEKSSGVDKQFMEAFISLGLTQWVKEATYPLSGNILDLILTTDSDRIGAVYVLPPIPGSDHCPTLCDYLFDHFNSTASAPRTRKKWHHGKYDKISMRLSDIDWDQELSCLDINDAYTRFLDIMSPLVEEYVPSSFRTPQDRKVPWKVHPPTSLITHRKAAWDKYKVVRSRLGRNSASAHDALANFFDVNNTVKRFASDSQSQYELKMLEDFKSNPRQLHSYIRQKKVGCPTVGPLRLEDGRLTDDALLMAETLALAFESVHTDRISTSEAAEHQSVEHRMSPVVLRLEDVTQTLKSLDESSAAGMDDIHPMLLKSCARQLSYPLLKLFRLSLRSHQLPSVWKLSRVVPIFKKGSRYVPLNYRPVSLTSVTCKCLERIIAKNLYNYLEEHDILSEHQFGFRAGRSTMDQMILVYNEISIWLDEGNAVDLILFDFAKAFDVVSHSILLTKLHWLGIDRVLIAWIEDFLTGRSMTVAVGDSHSSLHQVKSGVPQGSVLGPVLFLLFINHIASKLTCKYKIFADDLKIYMKVSDPAMLDHDRKVHQCQSDISMLNDTAQSWGLHLNKDKCVVLRFQRRFHHLPSPSYQIDGDVIQSVDSHSDLGVVVDSCLKFHLHILSTAQKAGGLAQSILKATVCRSPEFMLTLLTTHIRPILEYCSCLWHTGYISDIKTLESVQRRWTKRVERLSQVDYGTRLRTLNLYSVSGRLLRADMIFCWKIFHGKCSVVPEDIFSVSSDRGTRGHRYKVDHVRPDTDVRGRSFGLRVINQWNRLPDHVVALDDLKQFKAMLSDALGDKLFDYPR